MLDVLVVGGGNAALCAALMASTRAGLTTFMKKEDAKWGAIVRERKIMAN